MSTAPAASRPTARPIGVIDPVGWLVRHLYASNPFYVVSAGLTLVGLHLLFYDRDAVAHPNALTFDSWLLLTVLGGYAALLAITGVLIVRFGQVWDDARTILLTVALLFVAMSVSFDKLVLMSTVTFVQVLLVGLLFAAGLSEFMLRGLRIRLPLLYRAPYYLALGLFFLYPIWVMYCLDGVGDGNPRRGMELTLWSIFFFPSIAGLIALALLPAVLWGPSYVADSGTPWRWPLYPWSLFVFLGIGVVLRAYYLSLSFHAFPGVASAFGPYFLVPFFLSVAVVVFELGRGAESWRAQAVAVFAAGAVLFMGLPGTDRSGAYEQFLSMYVARAASPVVMAWWGLLLFYLYAWLRGFRLAEVGVVSVLVVGSVLGAETLDVRSLQFPAVEPLLVVSVWLLVRAVLEPRRSIRWFLALSSGIVTMSVRFWDTPFVAAGGIVPLHLILGIVLMLGLMLHDEFARMLRNAGSVGLMLAGIASVLGSEAIDGVTRSVLLAYLTSLCLVAWGYWFTLRGRLQLAAAIFVTGCYLSQITWWIVAALRRVRNSTGALLMLAGAASFVVGIGISTLKGLTKRQPAASGDDNGRA